MDRMLTRLSHEHPDREFPPAGGFPLFSVEDIPPFQTEGADRRVPPDPYAGRFPHIVQMIAAFPGVTGIEED